MNLSFKFHKDLSFRCGDIEGFKVYGIFTEITILQFEKDDFLLCVLQPTIKPKQSECSVFFYGAIANNF